MNQNSIAIVTGANSGMGMATSIELAKTGATVIMACRTPAKGQEAADVTRRASGNSKVYFMELNLASMKSIRAFAAAFQKDYGHLDVLVNNAGVILTRRTLTEDGFEEQFGVNHLGHFLLTNLLLPLMGKGSRVVVVSSGAHVAGKINFENLQLEKGYSTFGAYANSKLANILFVNELARRLKGTGITVNCLHPGAVATNMGIDRKTGFGKTLMGLLSLIFLTPAQGADTAIYLATSPEVEGVSGQYFYRRKPKTPSKTAQDKQLASRLWQESEQLSGLKRQ